MKRGYWMLLAGLLVGCAAVPTDPSASTGATAATEGDADKGTICRKEAAAGSITRQKVCTTAAEREVNARRAEMDADTVR
jgi:hypothetical protein